MPIDIRTPGLRWRTRHGARVAYWICPRSLAQSGYPVRTCRLWSGAVGTIPTEAEMQAIIRECFRLRSEARDWLKNPNIRKSKTYRQPGYIYFWKIGDKVKIGFAQNVRKRLGNLRHASPAQGVLLGTIPGTRQIEAFLHWQFRASRQNGEWFDLTPDLSRFITAHVDREQIEPKSGNGFGMENECNSQAVEITE